MFFPPTWPKPPPFKWGELHEAAAFILEQEVRLGPEAFEAWIKERPGAALIYVMLAEGEGLTDQLVRELQTLPMREGQLPAQLSELIDENGRIAGWKGDSLRPSEDEGSPSVAQHQWRTMSGVRYAAGHPKDRG